jgi:hypothetical protein
MSTVPDPAVKQRLDWLDLREPETVFISILDHGLQDHTVIQIHHQNTAILNQQFKSYISAAICIAVASVSLNQVA